MRDTEQKKIIEFLIFWIGTTIVVLAGASIFQGNIVLGTDKLAKSMAAVLAGFLLTLLFTITPQLVQKTGYKVKNENLWPVIFFSTNIVGIWIIKRLAMITGLGISSILFVLVLGVLVTVIQWAIGTGLGSMDKK